MQSAIVDIGAVLALYPDYDIIVGGDLNTEMTVNSVHSRLIMHFMNEFKLTLITDLITPDCKYTYLNTNNQSSLIDNFMISANVIKSNLQFNIVQDLINLSDHLPIAMSAELCINNTANETVHTSKSAPANIRLRWDHANLADYYSVCYERLQPIMNEIDMFYNTLECDVDYTYNDFYVRGFN